MAERFGMSPEFYAQMDAQRLKYWTDLLSIEGETSEALEGLGPDDDIVFYDDDDEDE